MFKAKISDVSEFKDSMKTISNLISEGLFQVEEQRLRLVAADPAMVALVDFRMGANAFSQYEAEEQKIGLNLENFYSILRRANSDDQITIEADESEASFNIIMEGASRREFSLPILNLSEDDIPNVDDLDDFTSDVVMDSSMFSDAIGDAQVVGDSVTLTSDGNHLTVVAKGDQSEAEFEVDESSTGVIEISGQDSESMFALDYLSKMSGAKSLSDNVTLRIGREFPLRLEYGGDNDLELDFILAPRIEEE